MSMRRIRFFRSSLAVLLALALVFSMSAMAFADETPDGGDQVVVTDPGEEGEPAPDGEGADPGDGDILPPDEKPGSGEEGIVPEEPGDEEGSADDVSVFPGMPGNYALSKDEKALKKELKDLDVLKSFSETISDEDYVEGEVLLITDSREYAETVAEIGRAHV